MSKGEDCFIMRKKNCKGCFAYCKDEAELKKRYEDMQNYSITLQEKEKLQKRYEKILKEGKR